MIQSGHRVSGLGHVARTAGPRVMPCHGGLTVRPTASKSVSRGFTLVEIVVALGIFSILMSGLFIVFTGIMKTVPQTNQASDAFERARGALSIIQDDLLNSYNSSDHSDIEAFYGTPIGFTFIGNTKVIDNSTTTANTNIARITYVVYNPQDDIDNDVYGAGKNNPCTGSPYQDEDRLVTTIFPNAIALYGCDANGAPLTDVNGVTLPPIATRDGYSYVLLRYVEPFINNLDTFPLDWSKVDLASLITEQRGYATSKGISTTDDELNKIARREAWIRALAGGDDPSAPMVVRNAWGPSGILKVPANTCLIPSHYLLTENVLSAVPPTERRTPANWWGQTSFTNMIQADATHPLGTLTPEVNVAFFNYGNMFEVGLDTTAITTPTNPYAFQSNEDSGFSTTQSPYSWWDDYQCADSGGWPLINGADPHLPPLVNVSFWLMFEKTNTSAPDFKRAFGMRIFLPAGYQRAQIYSP